MTAGSCAVFREQQNPQQVKTKKARALQHTSPYFLYNTAFIFVGLLIFNEGPTDHPRRLVLVDGNTEDPTETGEQCRSERVADLFWVAFCRLSPPDPPSAKLTTRCSLSSPLRFLSSHHVIVGESVAQRVCFRKLSAALRRLDRQKASHRYQCLYPPPPTICRAPLFIGQRGVGRGLAATKPAWMTNGSAVPALGGLSAGAQGTSNNPSGGRG